MILLPNWNAFWPRDLILNPVFHVHVRLSCAGPLMETFDDFWRMMWEQMSSVIVMLTKLEERGRVSFSFSRKCKLSSLTM